MLQIRKKRTRPNGEERLKLATAKLRLATAVLVFLVAAVGVVRLFLTIAGS